MPCPLFGGQVRGIEGIYRASRLGIDSHRRVALVCVTYSSSVSSVYGKFYVLRFDGTNWHIQKDVYFGPTVLS
ncbi:hypothetical protein BH18VER2_BH18VER2_08040 [soil metagenome]